MESKLSQTPETSPRPARAVVISADHWHIDFQGWYGNDWIETPALQKLASEGVVFDNCFAACVGPEWTARAWWTGRTQLPHPDPGGPATWELARLKSAGVRTVLITEASAEHIAEVAPPFDEVHVVRGEDDLDVSETETPIAHLVRRAETWLRDNTHEMRPTLLWIRSRGIPLPWLPPRGFADLYLEDFALIPDQSGPVAGPNEAEVEFPPEVEFPEEDLCEFAEEQDLTPEQARVPEETRFALAMYASYASLLDRWLGRLLRNLALDPHAGTTLLLFTTGVGQVFFPGESAPAVDLADLEGTTPLRGELIQTALIARLPGCVPGDADHAGTRRGALVQSIDVLPTVTEWLGLSVGSAVEGRSVLPLVRQTAEQIHDELLLGDGAGALALRTSETLYVETPATEEGDEPVVGLYGKPHDRWDAANLAKQQPGLAEELADRLKVRCGQRTEVQP